MHSKDAFTLRVKWEEPSTRIRAIIRQTLSWRRWEAREGALIVLTVRWRHKGRRERMCDWIWPSGRASCLLAPWMRSLCYNGKEWALAEALMGPSERIQGVWTNPQSQWRTGLVKALAISPNLITLAVWQSASYKSTARNNFNVSELHLHPNIPFVIQNNMHLEKNERWKPVEDTSFLLYKGAWLRNCVFSMARIYSRNFNNKIYKITCFNCLWMAGFTLNRWKVEQTILLKTP